MDRQTTVMRKSALVAQDDFFLLLRLFDGCFMKRGDKTVTV